MLPSWLDEFHWIPVVKRKSLYKIGTPFLFVSPRSEAFFGGLREGSKGFAASRVAEGSESADTASEKKSTVDEVVC